MLWTLVSWHRRVPSESCLRCFDHRSIPPRTCSASSRQRWLERRWNRRCSSRTGGQPDQPVICPSVIPPVPVTPPTDPEMDRISASLAIDQFRPASIKTSALLVKISPSLFCTMSRSATTEISPVVLMIRALAMMSLVAPKASRRMSPEPLAVMPTLSAPPSIVSVPVSADVDLAVVRGRDIFQSLRRPGLWNWSFRTVEVDLQRISKNHGHRADRIDREIIRFADIDASAT